MFKFFDDYLFEDEFVKKSYEIDAVVPLELDRKLVYAKIINIIPQTYYEIDFGDGTYSDDMMPEDIVVNDNFIK
jgi:hypothetical protein